MDNEKELIPRIVHYCWFGNNKMPMLERACMKTWKKLPKNYKIMRWDESTFDIENSIPYVKEAYSNKKYAFVSDYVRLYALYTYGGIYMDTDMELYRDFDKLLDGRSLVACFEYPTLVSAGFIATTPKNPIIKELLDTYTNRDFVDANGNLDLTPINFEWNRILREFGVVPNGQTQIVNDSIFIGSFEYFLSVSMETWNALYTDKTYTVHHYAGSWQNTTTMQKIKQKIVTLLKVLIGFKNYYKIKSCFK